MECCPDLFSRRSRVLWNAPNKVIGSIALKGGPFIGGIRIRSDARLILVAPQNRDELVRLLIAELLKQ